MKGRLLTRIGLGLVLVASTLISLVAPAKPASATAMTFTSVSGGDAVSCGATTGTQVFCWGDGWLGKLGIGVAQSRQSPVVPAGGKSWSAVSAGFVSTCAIDSAGAAYCWGLNDLGEVGDGTSGNGYNSPQPVSGGLTFSKISVGNSYACGITVGGAAYCWGDNAAGQIGNGNNTEQDSPALVAGGHTWVSISTGYEHTCGLDNSGAAYCWGADDYYQLGSGVYQNENTPRIVTGGFTWNSITTGGLAFHTCGITNTNVAKCWGMNDKGEIGLGSTSATVQTPTTVSGGQTFTQLALGLGHSCGITGAGAAYCWGENTYGQNGDGSTTDSNAPTAVAGGLTFSYIGGARSWNCGIASSQLYCWGNNGDGQLGDGTWTQRNTPVQVLFAAQYSNQSVTTTVDPSFSIAVSNRASACNGESNFVSSAGTATTVALGHIASGANVSGGQTLTISGNSGSGFSVYMRGTQSANNLRSAGHNWADVAGTYGSPAALGAGERFGYTYADSTSSSSVTNPASANFISLDSTNRAVMGSTSSSSGNACVSFDSQSAATTPAGTYTATIIYIAVPSF